MTIGDFGGAQRYVGASVRRKEDVRLLTGHGRYVDDVQRADMLHAAFVRSEVAKGRLNRIDCTAARALPGVIAVFTASDFEGRIGEAWHPILGEALPVPPPLATRDVRHVGEPIAMVVATSRYLAEDGCVLVEVEIDPLPPYTDYTDPDRRHIVHGAAGVESNIMQRTSVAELPEGVGLAKMFAAAATTVEVTIEQHRYVAVPMETRGIVAEYQRGRAEMRVACATQSVHESRNFCSRYLSLPEGAIHVEAWDVGGGFGQKGRLFREECAVLLAARILESPVKWIEDRWENLVSAGHSRNERGTVRLAIADDLTIDAIAIEDHIADVGAYPISPSAMNGGLLSGPYRIPALGYDSSWIWTNTMGRTAYRGPWLFETTAREMAIDHAARVLGVDAIELRRRNLLSAADLPHTTPSGYVFEDITPRETLEQALAALDFERFRAEQREARTHGRYLGLGCCVYVEPSAMKAPTLATEAAAIRVEASGRVVAYLGTTSHGQSVETTMAQIVADTLGVRFDDVTVIQGDSQSTPYGPITGGSRTAVIAGGAARRAALTLREKILEVAGFALEADPADLSIDDGRVFVRGTPSRSMSLRDIATIAYRHADQLPAEFSGGLEATERFKPGKFPTWSNATHLCVVEVDIDTCAVNVLRYIVSEDCGTMINPMIVDGQVSGGTVQGLGGVLFEHFVYDAHGHPLTTTFLDYLLPTASEVPEIEIHHLVTPSSTNPDGFKGMGEGGAIGSHAAVANAVGDALAPLGIHVTSTPLGPSDIHRLIAER